MPVGTGGAAHGRAAAVRPSGIRQVTRKRLRERIFRSVPVRTGVRTSFSTPSHTLQIGTGYQGAGYQEFRVQVRKTGPGVDPLCRIELHQTGTSDASPLATVLADTPVSSTTGVVLSGTWDASLLSQTDGSGVECRVVGTAITDASLEIGAIEWNAVQAPLVTGGFIPADTGFYGATLGAAPANTGVEVSFANPANLLLTGAGVQEFRVQVRRSGTGPDPTVSLYLYENGVQVGSPLITNQAISAPTVLSATWNAASLSQLSGANVSLRVVGTNSTNGSVEVGAIEWNAIEQIAPVVIGGYIPAPSDTQFYGARVYGATVTVTGGFIPAPSASQFYGVQVRGPVIQASFIGPLTAGEYAPGNYPPRSPKDEVYGGSFTVGAQAGFIPAASEFYGASVSSNVTAGFIAAPTTMYGAAISLAATAGFFAGYIPEASEFYGVSIYGPTASVTADFIPAAVEFYGAAITQVLFNGPPLYPNGVVLAIGYTTGTYTDLINDPADATDSTWLTVS